MGGLTYIIILCYFCMKSNKKYTKYSRYNVVSTFHGWKYMRYQVSIGGMFFWKAFGRLLEELLGALFACFQDKCEREIISLPHSSKPTAMRPLGGFLLCFFFWT